MVRLYPFSLLFLLLTAAPLFAEEPTTRPRVVSDVLGQKVNISLEGKTIKQVFDEIQAHTGLNFIVSWYELEFAGTSLDRKLSGRLIDVKLSLVIDHVIAAAGDYGGNLPQVEYSDVDGPVLRIRTEPRKELRFYNISKLTAKLLKEKMAIVGASQVSSAEVTDDIIKLITTSVAPEVWREAGGTTGSISLIGMRLAIEQSPPAHEKIRKLLDDLEKADGK